MPTIPDDGRTLPHEVPDSPSPDQVVEVAAALARLVETPDWGVFAAVVMQTYRRECFARPMGPTTKDEDRGFLLGLRGSLAIPAAWMDEARDILKVREDEARERRKGQR